MKRVIAIASAGVTAVVLALTITVAAQQPMTFDKTLMTFSGPVELPGLRLEGGTYVFKLADTPLRNIVQVWNKDETDILGQWLYVSAERPEVTGDTIVTFRETAAGATPAVQFWYYPGEKSGKEFVYPKDQAMRIAARTGATVQSVEGDISAGAEITPITPGAAQTTPRTGLDAAAPANEPAPAAEPVTSNAETVRDTQSAVAGTDPAAAGNDAALSAAATAARDREQAAVGTSGQQQDSSAARELPQTASPLALTGLLGLLSLVGAAGLRAFRL